MATKEETALQARLQTLIKKRGGYVKKNHGNMITVKGLADLSFTYQGLSVFWEVKTPQDATNVSVEQGIHCRLAKKAGAITAIVTSVKLGEYILDFIDSYLSMIMYNQPTFEGFKNAYGIGWDDGTSY